MAPVASTREQACFEAGIKFGSLYHQFTGTPVSPATAESLERAIEESIENQPACEAVSFEIDRAALRARVSDRHGYAELSGELMDCRIEVVVDDVRVVAELIDRDGYPEMTLTEITPIDG